MVQILPPPTSLGSEVGQALGQGIQQGSQLGFQRGVLQEGLSKAAQAFQNPNLSDAEKSLAFINSIAGIPGSERYAEPMLKMLLGQSRNENIFGKKGALNAAGGMQEGIGVQNALPGSPEAVSPEKQGFLINPLTPQQLDAFAKNYAAQHQDPSRYGEGYAIAQKRNEEAGINRNLVGQLAASTGKVDAKLLPQFLQLAQKHGAEANPESVVTATLPEFGEYKRLVQSLEDQFYPGVGTSLREPAIKAASTLAGMPILGKMVEGGDSREKALKSLSGTAKKLAEMGFEQDVRNKLASEHLSPTEIQEVLKPLPKEQLARLNSLPDASKVSQADREKHLSAFIKDNVKPDTSLLVLRDKLMNKGYSWEDTAEAMEENRKNFTISQDAEMAQVSQPPIQSLTNLFRGWLNWVDILRGNK
jgi:SOS response regulatory protein OraA/RecX